MFVFFPEDPKVGIKIIKQLVDPWNAALPLSHCLYLPCPGIVSACRRRIFPVQSLSYSKAWRLLPNRAWWIWHPSTSWSNSWRPNSWSISRNMSWYEQTFTLVSLVPRPLCGEKINLSLYIWFPDFSPIKSRSTLGTRLLLGSFDSWTNWPWLLTSGTRACGDDSWRKKGVATTVQAQRAPATSHTAEWPCG